MLRTKDMYKQSMKVAIEIINYIREEGYFHYEFGSYINNLKKSESLDKNFPNALWGNLIRRNIYTLSRKLGLEVMCEEISDKEHFYLLCK